MRRATQSLLTLLFLFSFAFLLASPTSAQSTQAWTGVCTHNREVGGVATIQGVQCLVGNILQITTAGIGFAGFVMLIFGSFKYLISGGNAKEVDDGRKMMVAAVVGLVLALSAFFILNILADFTGVDEILNFTIPGPTDTILEQ